MKIKHLEVGGQKFPLMPPIIPHFESLKEKLLDCDYEKNIFLMMKYRTENDSLAKFIVSTLKEAGLTCVRADMEDWNLTHDDVINPLAVLYCCKYGIALFDEPEEGQNYSPNVAYELGIMHYQHKNCLILINHKIADKKPFDLIGKLHSTYKKELEVKTLIEDWIKKNKIGIPSVAKEIEHVGIAVVRKGKQFLITKRKTPEDNLVWGFPAKRLRLNGNNEEQLQNEVFAETNIRSKIVSFLGQRTHLGKKCELKYWECEYLSGRIKNKDTNELEEVKWVSAQEALNLISPKSYDKVKGLLKKYL